MEMSCYLLAWVTLHRGKKRGAHCIGGWVDPRKSLHVLEKTKICAPSGTPATDRPARGLLTTATTLLRLPLHFGYVNFLL